MNSVDKNSSINTSELRVNTNSLNVVSQTVMRLNDDGKRELVIQNEDIEIVNRRMKIKNRLIELILDITILILCFIGMFSLVLFILIS